MKTAGATVCFIIIQLSLNSGAFAQSKTLIVESGPDWVLLDHFPGAHRSESVSLYGRAARWFPEAETGDPWHQSESGLPAESFLLGIPPLGKPTLEVISFATERTEGFLLARTAAIEREGDGESAMIRRKFEFVGEDGYSGAPPATIGATSMLRSQRTVSVQVLPYSFDGASQTLTRITRIRLRVRFGPTGGGAEVRDPHFETTLRSVIVNYEQSRRWRVPFRGVVSPAAHSRLVGPSTDGEWFVPGEMYYRLKTNRSGVVRITPDDLRSAGLTPETIDPNSIEVFFRGRSLSLYSEGGGDGSFDEADVLEFFSSRPENAAGEADAFSDTSVYWIHAGGGSGPRAWLDTIVVSQPDTADYYTAENHRESDLIYHYGDGGLPNNNQSAVVDGEGWYWLSLRPGVSRSFTINVSSRYLTNDPSYRLAIRVHSPVFNQAMPNHVVEVKLNGATLGVDSLSGYQSKTIEMSGPVSQTLGTNTIQVTSLATGAAVNELLLDWVDLKYPRQYRPSGDSIIFIPDRVAPGTVKFFRLPGFTTDSISLYRIDSLGGVDKKVKGRVTGSGTSFAISFSDTVLSGRRYTAVTSAKKLAASPLEPVVFGNLRSTSNGADYVIISAPEFRAEAQRLAAYRAGRGIGRTLVVAVDEIYDQFGFGFADPYAIQRFIRSADSLWVAPSPAYILLFGDANWDFKGNLGSTRRNYVPAIGNPVSDVLYVSTDANPYVPTKYIGRIPCTTPEQAAVSVDRIMEYESLMPNIWHKQYLLMVGGFDPTETQRFSNFSESLVNQYIAPAPLGGLVSRFYRNISQVTTPEEQDSARQRIEQGGVWVNYIGHGGTDLWGNGIDKAASLKNIQGRRHVISDISCSTVRFAEPSVESFSEDLFFAEEGGAIAFVGSSGFGYESPLQTLSRAMFRQLVDSVREIGKLVFGAKVSLWGGGSSSVITRGAMQQYTLIGDPALTVAIPDAPDYFVDVSQISSNPAVPSDADPLVTVRAVLSNVGLQGTDSVGLLVEEKYQLQTETLFSGSVGSFAAFDTVTVASPSLSRGGVHTIRFIVDPEDSIMEVDETNNSTDYSLAVNSGSILAILPMPSSEQHPDSVAIVVQNPSDPSQASWKFVVELDASGEFAGPTVLRFEIPQQPTATELLIPEKVLEDSIRYRWRARFEGDGQFTSWVGSDFRTNSLNRVGWVQEGDAMFRLSDVVDLSVGDSIRLFSRMSSVEVYSAGFNAGLNASITMDGENISQGFASRGYNVAVFNEFNGTLETFGAFNIYSDAGDTSLSEPIVDFLNAIPQGRRVIVAVSDEGQKGKSEALNVALEACGSAMIRSLTFRGSWALIGWKGAPVGSVPEGRATGATPVTIYDTLMFQATSGTITSPMIGPSSQWGRVFFSVDTSSQGTHASLEAVVYRTSGLVDTLRELQSGVPLFAPEELNPIDGVRLRMTLASDIAGNSPIMTRWSLDIQPPPELLINDKQVTLSGDSVLIGSTLSVQSAIVNVGSTPAKDVRVVTTLTNLSRGTTDSDTTIIPTISAQGVEIVATQFSTLFFGGSNLVRVEVNPGGLFPELHTSNNVYTLPVSVLADTVRPSMDVTFDGEHIFDGDYVSSRPTIRIDIDDDNPTPISDPGSVTLLLDGERVTLGSSPDSLFEPASGTESARVTYRPALKTGTHRISVQAKDVTGNDADTSAREYLFRVEENPGLLNVMNFPNPFGRSTKFTFNLVGSQRPDELTVRIYTVAGRLIRELRRNSSELRMGFNTIDWDGSDRDGNEVANGVYLYRIRIQTAGTSEEVIEKMARVR